VTSEPAIRAAVTKDFIDVLDSVRPELWQRMLAELPADDRLTIEKTLRIAWLPLELHLRLNEAARRLAGLDAYREAWCRAMVRTFEQPILKPIVEAGVRLFGFTPMTLARLTPRVWGFLFRDAGGARWDAGPTDQEARIAVDGFPAAPREAETFFAGLVGVFQAFFVLTKVRGTVEIAEQAPAEGHAAFVIRWHG